MGTTVDAINISFNIINITLFFFSRSHQVPLPKIIFPSLQASLSSLSAASALHTLISPSLA
jgi:hypothetical protein